VPDVLLLLSVDALKRHSDNPEVADIFKLAVSEYLKHAPKRVEG
jgi:hypothetical protein